MQRARKSFNAILASAGASQVKSRPAAPVALSFARAELIRRGSNHRLMAVHALAWAASSSVFKPADEKALQPLSDHE